MTITAARPLLLNFSASWCGPCQRMKPLVTQITAERSTDLDVHVVDVDAQPELAAEYQIRSVPTFVLVVDGQETARRTGGMPKTELDSWLDQHLSS